MQSGFWDLDLSSLSLQLKPAEIYVEVAGNVLITVYKGIDTLHWTPMVDGILKFMIGHLRLVLIGQQDFKVCDWPLRLVSGGQSQTLISTRPSWTSEPRPKWPSAT